MWSMILVYWATSSGETLLARQSRGKGGTWVLSLECTDEERTC